MPPKFLRRSRVRTAGRCRKIRSRTEYPQLFHYSMNPPLEVSAGLIFRDGQLLITQRRAGSHLGGLWEFPGGKREAGETLEQCLARELREELGVDDAFDLTGLYDGIPLTEKSTAEQMTRPDVVWLFRRPILDEWAERGNVSIQELVTHVVIHEIAHHFGWSDDDIAAIDPWWE